MRAESRWTVNNSMIAGAGGGLVASVATCPLDVIKTKLQAQQARQGDKAYRGVFKTIKYILATDGIRGLYRGLGPTILGYLPTWAIYFAVYDSIKTRFGELPLGSPDSPSQQHEGREKKKRERDAAIYPAPQAKGYQPLVREHPWSLHILSAMTAGASSTICTNPLWVIKTRFQTQPVEEGRYRNTLDAIRTIYRSEGISAFYRGLLPSLFGTTHAAVQFPLYEKLKVWMQGDSPAPLTSTQILACSGTAKMCASIVTYPHEVVRTRLQTQRRPLNPDPNPTTPSPNLSRPIPSPLSASASTAGKSSIPTGSAEASEQPHGGVIYTAKKIVSKEGWRGLYKGLSINLFRTVPNSAVTMLTYELLMRRLTARGTSSSESATSATSS